MCFSNLPIEFDADGNPSLAEAADEVDPPDGCLDDAEAVDEDPEAAYAAIMESIPESARKEFEDGYASVESGRSDRHESARSD